MSLPLKLPSRTLMLLKVVLSAIRESSDLSAVASVLIALRESTSFESFALWTARSRIRWRIACDSVSAPSAVCTTEMPSWALRTATLRPPTCERRPSEIARPAASSAARLMRKPDDSFSSDLARSFCVLDRLRYELVAAMFWLIERPMMELLLDSGRNCRPSMGWHPSHRQARSDLKVSVEVLVAGSGSRREDAVIGVGALIRSGRGTLRRDDSRASRGVVEGRGAHRGACCHGGEVGLAAALGDTVGPVGLGDEVRVEARVEAVAQEREGLGAQLAHARLRDAQLGGELGDGPVLEEQLLDDVPQPVGERADTGAQVLQTLRVQQRLLGARTAVRDQLGERVHGSVEAEHAAGCVVPRLVDAGDVG